MAPSTAGAECRFMAVGLSHAEAGATFAAPGAVFGPIPGPHGRSPGPFVAIIGGKVWFFKRHGYTAPLLRCPIISGGTG